MQIFTGVHAAAAAHIQLPVVMCVQVLKRCQHLLMSADARLRLSVLDTISHCCLAMSSHYSMLLCLSLLFLQHVSIACYAERCISYDRFCPSDRLSHAGIMPKRL